MTVHFVYAVPTAASVPGWMWQRGIQAVQRTGAPVSYVGPRGRVRTDLWPERAPTSITKNVYRALLRQVETKLYDLREHVLIRGGRDDVLIGHYWPRDEMAVWQRSCREGRFALRVAMNPLSHHMAEVCGELDPYVSRVDRIFGIMGPYWYDTWKESPLAHWYPKIVPFDMAIDVDAFPRIKSGFNPPGKRRFLYLGAASPQKGTHLLSILFGLAPHHTCVAVGPATRIPNVSCRPRVQFAPRYLYQLAEECDFVIVPGVSDANPTVVLEAMAWGFPVCCTPQSGYNNMPEILGLSTTDMRHNVALLDMLQQASEHDLLTLADRARTLVATRYTWTRFVATLTRGLNEAASEKGLRPLFKNTPEDGSERQSLSWR